MKLSYRPIGDFIRQVKIKNSEGLYNDLQGINIDKFFMPSVANTVGVDLKKYKIIKKGQFACNRMHVGRDYRIPVALSREVKPFIVSPAYNVFEIIDNSILDPEYLMMWFSRPEFDRNAWFYTDADVRGGLPWDSFTSTELPIPSLEKQLEIVKQYNKVIDRIKLNETLNEKLEAVAKALYRQWFVDFEFPNKEGKPYKFSGGAMVWNDELDKEIPEGWEAVPLKNFTEINNGFSYKGGELKKSKTALITIKNFSKNGLFKTNGYKEIETYRAKEIHFANEGDVIVAHTDLTKGAIIGKSIIILDSFGFDKLIISMDTVKVNTKSNNISNSLIRQIINDKSFSDYAMGFVNGSTVLHLSKKALPNYDINLPKDRPKINKLSEDLNSLTTYQKHIIKIDSKLIEAKTLLLSKMTSIEDE